MRKRNCRGFALMEVLVLIMLILLFLTSAFGMARFHHQTALQKLQREEAGCAAEAALELMEAEVLNGTCNFAENGLKKTKTELEFESENGENRVQIPVTVWARRSGDILTFYAEAEVGSRKEERSQELDCPLNDAAATSSDSELATSSTAVRQEENRGEIVEK